VGRVRLTPAAYRRVTLAALVGLAFIIVTGGAVRLTGSGLGCPNWPTCAKGRVVAPLEYHAMIEFVNRMVTGAVSIAVIVAVLGSLARVPRRRDLVWLSFGLVLGVLGQIVLGGLTVLFHLRPQFVMAHFLLSIWLVTNAVVLHHRAGDDQPGRLSGRDRPLVVSRATAMAGRALVVATVTLLFAGTVVTASGPHGGDEDVERLALSMRDVTRVHSVAAWIVVLLSVVVAVLAMRGSPSSPVLLRRTGQLLGALVVQGTIGYIQYFQRLPPGLVVVHLFGATLVWICVLRVVLALRGAPGTVPAQLPADPTAKRLAPVAAG
jgi:cytochrome c oxidase assembly protein subunit 15